MNTRPTSNSLYIFQTYYLEEKTKVLAPTDKELDKHFELDQKEFPFPWGQDYWLQLKAKRERTYLLSAYEKKVLVGFILLGLDIFDLKAHLYKILVKKDKRGAGLGKNLLERVICQLRDKDYQSLFLEVSFENQVAQRLYLKAGFQVMRRVAKYYSNGDDALTMEYLIES